MTQLAAPITPTETRSMEIALVGSPNTGKSALFNRLTGGRQRVGNYPGLTVEKKEGRMQLGGRAYTVLDLPGAYSLSALSADERVVLDVLTGHIRGTSKPDLIVLVVEACNLHRHLFLASQLAETGLPIVIALNMWDELKAKGMDIDVATLSARLGVPVIPTVAYKGQGIDQLKSAIWTALEKNLKMRPLAWPAPVDAAVDRLRDLLAMLSGRPISEVELRRLLFDLEPIGIDRLGLVEHDWKQSVAEARLLLRDAGLNPGKAEAEIRFKWAREICGDLIRGGGETRRGTSDRIDDILTHRVFGLIIFVGVMYLVFQSIYTLAKPVMELIESAFSALGGWVGGWLSGMPLLQSLVVDGVISGVGGVLVFLPQILILFLFISLLEDAGYMPRAAFLMDRLFGWCGLSGKCFVPLLSSYACAVPGLMSTRTIEDPKARLTTILIAPLMSCSARLPVYVLMIGAFVEPRYGTAVAGMTLLAMHFIGLAIAVPVAWLLNRVVLRGVRTPFVLEMPPYRLPHARDIYLRIHGRGREFVIRAGTVIFAVSIIIWALSYFPRPPELAREIRRQWIAQVAHDRKISERDAQAAVEKDHDLSSRIDAAISAGYLERSYIGRAGKFVQPVFAPAGFDWKITVGVLASFPAREVIISTLGILYDLGTDVDEADEGLTREMSAAAWPDGRPVFTPVVAVAVMIFFALCSQCAATLATIAKESRWSWAVFAFCYMTALAWLGAVLVYQIGSRLF